VLLHSSETLASLPRVPRVRTCISCSRWRQTKVMQAELVKASAGTVDHLKNQVITKTQSVPEDIIT
jgi:hypothetical protein